MISFYFRRRDFGHMDVQITIDDPSTFTRPWTTIQDLTKNSDQKNQVYEGGCHEGKAGSAASSAEQLKMTSADDKRIPPADSCVLRPLLEKWSAAQPEKSSSRWATAMYRSVTWMAMGRFIATIGPRD